MKERKCSAEIPKDEQHISNELALSQANTFNCPAPKLKPREASCIEINDAVSIATSVAPSPLAQNPFSLKANGKAPQKYNNPSQFRCPKPDQYVYGPPAPYQNTSYMNCTQQTYVGMTESNMGNSTFSRANLPVGTPIDDPSLTAPSNIYPEKTFKRSAVLITCCFCGREGVTTVDHMIVGTTYAISLVLFCTLCPLMCVPFCAKDCQHTIHRCPYCKAILSEMPPCT